MKNKFNSIINNPLSVSVIITLLTKVESLWSLSNLIIKQSTTTSKMENIIQINSNSYWIFQATSTIVIFVFAYYLLSKIYKIREQLKVTEIISTLRTKNLFVLHYDNIEVFKTPYESNEEYINRLPEGKFKDYLIKEQEEVKKLIIDLLDKSPSESEKLMNGVY